MTFTNVYSCEVKGRKLVERVFGGLVMVNILTGLSSGILWSLYTIGLYWILNVYAGIDSSNMILLVVGTLVISIIDTLLALCTEIVFMTKMKSIKIFTSMISSGRGLRILPASILAGLFGIVPYAICSSESVVASSLTMAYPVVGAVAAYILLKQQLNVRQWIGVLITGVLSIILGVLGQSINMSLLAFLLAIVVMIGWGCEAIFGYKLMSDDVDPIVTIALRHFYSILLFIILIVMLVLFGNVDLSYLSDVTTSITSTVNIPFPIIFIISSVIGSVSYILWYVSMKNLEVAKAMILNVSYGVWTPIITTLLGLSILSGSTIMIIIGVFLGMSLVVYERSSS